MPSNAELLELASVYVERLVAVAEFGTVDRLADLVVDLLGVLSASIHITAARHAAIVVDRADPLRVLHVALAGAVDHLLDVGDQRVILPGTALATT